MADRKILLAMFIGAAASAAPASVMVIGNSNARLCYEAADSPLVPRMARSPGSATRRCFATGWPASRRSRPTSIAASCSSGSAAPTRRSPISTWRSPIDPQQPEAYLNKGAALIRRRTMRPTRSGLFTVALERNTSRPDIAHYGRAVANEALGNLAAAYRDYRRASELDPDWEEPRAELARFRVVEQ